MGRRGFTLIELLISMTIIGMVLVIVMGAFRIGISAWEKGDADMETNQRRQIVLELVKQQLASMRHTRIVNGDGDAFYFKADKDSMDFVSGISIVPANRYGQVLVRYRIREQSDGERVMLEIYEQSLALVSEDSGGFKTSEDNWHLLIGDMAAIEFQFFLKDQRQEISQWQHTWRPGDQDADLPSAVRLVLQADDDASAMGIIARVMDESVDS